MSVIQCSSIFQLEGIASFSIEKAAVVEWLEQNGAMRRVLTWLPPLKSASRSTLPFRISASAFVRLSTENCPVSLLKSHQVLINRFYDPSRNAEYVQSNLEMAFIGGTAYFAINPWKHLPTSRHLYFTGVKAAYGSAKSLSKAISFRNSPVPLWHSLRKFQMLQRFWIQNFDFEMLPLSLASGSSGPWAKAPWYGLRSGNDTERGRFILFVFAHRCVITSLQTDRFASVTTKNGQQLTNVMSKREARIKEIMESS